jgi:RNA polymerase sigma factor (sigma-70 family)
MSVVIVDIKEKTSKKYNTYNVNSSSSELILPLYEYIDIAKKSISKFSSASVAKSMLKDEDAISFVVEHLIKGTIRWKQNGGRTFKSYLSQCAIWSIQRWLLNSKNARKNDVIHLDNEFDDEGSNLYKLVKDKSSENINIEDIIDKNYLNDTQKECLRMKFVHGMTYRSIGEIMNKSHQRIEQIIKSALVELRKEYVK